MTMMRTATEAETWRTFAACAGVAEERGSFDLFFEPQFEKEAKKICAQCPVRSECLEFAMRGEHRTPQVWDGIFGGMNADERSRAYRRWLHWSNLRGRTKEQWDAWVNQDRDRGPLSRG